MKFVGADIRVVNLPQDEVVGVVREFIGSNNLRKERDEELAGKVTHISAGNPIDSYLRFWWRGTPQIIDWKIVEVAESETRIEAHFGLQKGFRIWFWAIAVILSLLMAIFLGLGRTLLLAKGTEDRVHSLLPPHLLGIIIPLLLLLFAAFVMKFFLNDYASFLTSFKGAVKKRNLSYCERVIQSDLYTPHSVVVVLFVLSLLAIFIGTHMTLFVKLGPSSPIGIAVGAVFFILIVLCVMAYFCVTNADFNARFQFGMTGMGLSVFFLFFNGLPVLNAYTSLPPMRDYLVLAGIQFKTNSNSELFGQYSLVFQEVLRSHFLFFVFTSLALILVAIIEISWIPAQLRNLRRWKRDVFSGNWVLSHGRVADFRTFERKFIYGVLAFWVVVSAALYILGYTILSILEFSIFDDQFLFHSSIGQMFCIKAFATFGFFLQPLMGSSGVNLLVRVVLVWYCVPLLWTLCKVIDKRIRDYLKNVLERRKYLADNESDSLGLRKSAMEIAQYFNVTIPEIVIVPSRIPILRTKYLGFPYFRSYVLMSEGCRSLGQDALLGLLAHEIYHMKKHSLKWWGLKLLSDYTLFGSGFLAICTNSYQHELEADHYAAKWIKAKGSVSAFIRGLETMYLWGSIGRREDAGLELTFRNYQSGEKADGKQKSFLKRAKKNIDMLFDFYFGEEILSYIHPPLEERIERIRAVAEGEAEG